MDINQVGATSPEEYEDARMAAKFAMTNEDLANAIDTAARHSESRFGPGKRENIMLDHLQKLLELQLRRAAIVKIGGPQIDTMDRRLRVKLDGSYGAELEGHWFYVVPADEWAELALSTHTKTPNAGGEATGAALCDRSPRP